MNIALDKHLDSQFEVPLKTKTDRPVFEPTRATRPPETNGEIPTPAAPTPERANHKKKIFLGLAAVIALVATGIYYSVAVMPYESTDDAFIEAHVTPVAPQIAGRVLKLSITDNQAVKAGDVLVEIDPRDYQVKLDQAQANLLAAQSRVQQAKAQYAVDKATAAQELASVTAADADAERASADLKRYQSVEARAISRSQLDLAAATARSTAAQVQVAHNRADAAAAQVELSKSKIDSMIADVHQKEAVVRQDELNLSYTKVVAPEDGYVTRRSVESGAYVQTGQALLAIVPSQVWIVANFKETQLNHMKAGQPVTVKVDAYPSIQFKGHVDSIQAGSGARFSLLPPENASGNYVKVVQRVPVKIVLDDLGDSARLLGPGMSATPEVKIQ